MKGLKICGISDPETLNYILNHNQKPTMIGFITNYKKSNFNINNQGMRNFPSRV